MASTANHPTEVCCGCAQVMVKKKRTKKVSVPVVAHTFSLTEDDVSVRWRCQILQSELFAILNEGHMHITQATSVLLV